MLLSNSDNNKYINSNKFNSQIRWAPSSHWRNLQVFLGSCYGLCGGSSSNCYCDKNCVINGDCCPDYTSHCDTSHSCYGRCGHVSGAGCHCDTQCYQIGDCCSDYNLQCVNPITTTPATTVINTCAGRCSSGQSGLVRVASSSNCYCDPGCVSVGDCCPDYQQQCQQTTGKTTTSTVPTPSGSCVGKCANSLFRLSARQGKVNWKERNTWTSICGELK